jgi:hypothetical protein
MCMCVCMDVCIHDVYIHVWAMVSLEVTCHRDSRYMYVCMHGCMYVCHCGMSGR